jgi:phosphotransferase system HPr (HPr) family protein
VKKVEAELRLNNVHMRPLLAISTTASRFESKIVAKIDGIECNAKSFLELIEAAASASNKSLFCFSIDGTDADDAAVALRALETSMEEFVKS